ncbi:hypothetical protein P43SY_004745 [Pythium insidiosum]|uniref:V-SNARE coiled-coil homology domain-containing protein n=1 Tax=Pythium insidiosum TaxID=114742 RepID=A0AAD5LXV6_PYTIN|nr:hypothetical protein P43SY_004745 [Pythium insidiosum]
MHEETGKASTYTITPRDVGITTTEEDKHLQYVTAMAANPRDANQLLLAFEASATVFLWDFAKHKVIKEFSLAASKSSKHAAPSGSGVDAANEPNAVLSLSWHASGKRFVAGFKHGGFGVFRVDKDKGLYHTVPRLGTAVNDAAAVLMPIKQIQWICAPPTSRHSHLPGAIIFTGGRPATETHVITLVCPPRGMPDEDAITSLVKSEQILWQVATIDSPAECPSVGSRLDGIHAGIAYDGEIIIANAFGEIERLSLLAEAPARESAMLQLHSVTMRLWLEERKLAFDKEHAPSPKKKSGIAALKKLVTGVVKEAGDLNKVFHFSVEEAQRKQLMGNRKSVAQKGGENGEQDSSKQVSEGLAGTKDALAQATMKLHERGEKLGDLALKTEQMKDTAEDFYKTMKAFNDKNANKKWYEF